MLTEDLLDVEVVEHDHVAGEDVGQLRLHREAAVDHVDALASVAAEAHH